MHKRSTTRRQCKQRNCVWNSIVSYILMPYLGPYEIHLIFHFNFQNSLVILVVVHFYLMPCQNLSLFSWQKQLQKYNYNKYNKNQLTNKHKLHYTTFLIDFIINNNNNNNNNKYYYYYYYYYLTILICFVF